MTKLQDDAYHESLGRAIKVLRTSRGLERRQLAEQTGLSYPYLSEIENGKKQPSSKVLLQLAEALEVRPHELLEMGEALSEGRSPLPMVAMPADAAAKPSGSRWFGAVSPAVMNLRESARAPAAPAAAPPPPANEKSSEPSTRGKARSLKTARRELKDLIDNLGAEELDLISELARRLIRN